MKHTWVLLCSLTLLAARGTALAGEPPRKVYLASESEASRAPGDSPRSQYESALITSPLWIEPSAIQMAPLIEFFMNRTEPSPNKTVTPPG